MTIAELAGRVVSKVGLSQAIAQDLLQQAFSEIVEVLVTDGQIELRRFGTFQVKKRKARRGRNPRTGERMLIPEKMAVTFKPAKEMKERVNNVTQAPETS